MKLPNLTQTDTTINLYNHRPLSVCVIHLRSDRLSRYFSAAGSVCDEGWRSTGSGLPWNGWTLALGLRGEQLAGSSGVMRVRRRCSSGGSGTQSEEFPLILLILLFSFRWDINSDAVRSWSDFKEFESVWRSNVTPLIALLCHPSWRILNEQGFDLKRKGIVQTNPTKSFRKEQISSEIAFA